MYNGLKGWGAYKGEEETGGTGMHDGKFWL